MEALHTSKVSLSSLRFLYPLIQLSFTICTYVMKPRQSWSILVLCYNEAGTIADVLAQVVELMPQFSTAAGEIIVVNDVSQDQTHDCIQHTMACFPHTHWHYIQHPTNLGIGPALRAGYAVATGDNVVMIPGDGQFDLLELMPHCNLPEATILAFYRVENTTYTLTRNILSWINRRLNEWLLGLHLKDVNWVKAYKTKELQALDLEVYSSLVESEICSKLLYLGHEAIEVKSRYLPRRAGQSKGASWAIVRQALCDVPILIRAFRRFRKKR